jgi:hypothetical protein
MDEVFGRSEAAREHRGPVSPIPGTAVILSFVALTN